MDRAHRIGIGDRHAGSGMASYKLDLRRLKSSPTSVQHDAARHSPIWLLIRHCRNGSPVPACITQVTLRTPVVIRLDQFSLDCVHYGFKAVMGTQLLIDVVQVVAQGLLADVERFCNLGLVLAFRK